eukprot:8991895-Heterocapsa_arctica.AAC.1
MMLHAIMHVAVCDMRLLGCVGARLGHHVPHIKAVAGIDETMILLGLAWSLRSSRSPRSRRRKR